MVMGQESNRSPSEHPNPTTKIGSKMGEFMYENGIQNGFDHLFEDPPAPTLLAAERSPCRSLGLAALRRGLVWTKKIRGLNR